MEHHDLSGQVLDGRYRVLAPIGQGAMGCVYRAEHLKLGRVVAIKVMNEQVPNEMSARRRFDREAATMAKLEHPNCASVLDVGVHGDQPFVVMEFISGRSLDALVAEGPLPIPRAVEITRQILSGLAHAHELGIIHRDIKPANIILSQKSGVGDHVKVLDFGLAKLSQETSNLTMGFIVGTPSYMAPEQIRGLALDQRVDVYACGVLLFELLTAVKPFRGPSNDPLAVCMMHLNTPPPRLADVMPGRDFGALEDVLAHALAKDRDRRFTTAGAFANALTGAVSTQHPPADTAAPARPSAQRSAPPGATMALADADLVQARSSPKLTSPVAPFGATMALADADLVQSRSSPSLAPPVAPFGATMALGDADLVQSRSSPSLAPPVAPFGATMALDDADLVQARSSPKLTSPVAPVGATMALDDADLVQARSSPSLAPLPAPATERSAPITAQPQVPPRKKRLLAIGGAAIALIAAIVLVVVSRGDKATPPPAPSVGSSTDTKPPPGPPAPPEDPVAELVTRANELVEAHQREAAISLLMKARRPHPGDGRLPYHAGLLYMEKMFRSDGLKQLRAAIELEPSYKTDQKLIAAVVRAFNTTAQTDWTLANFLRNDIGDAAKPVLEEVAKTHPNPIVRARAAAELRRY